MSLSFSVSPEKNASLRERMEKLGIKESDLEESFTRSGGNGGQNVNKVATAVFLRHTVSGIEVKCSIHRTQGLNRYKARDILCRKLEEKISGKESESARHKNKIKKNKAKRDKRHREKISELRVQELESSSE